MSLAATASRPLSLPPEGALSRLGNGPAPTDVSQLFEVHPDNPQPRLLKQAAQMLDGGGICAVPTDSSYALVCHLDDKAAADTLRRLRGVDGHHPLTLLCRDLSELASYARVDNRQYRLLQHGTA